MAYIPCPVPGCDLAPRERDMVRHIQHHHPADVAAAFAAFCEDFAQAIQDRPQKEIDAWPPK